MDLTMILIIVQEHRNRNGLHLVLSHLGAIIIGSLLTNRIISKDALPEPTIIPAVRAKVQYLECLYIFLDEML
jgi:hypothetical protein